VLFRTERCSLNLAIGWNDGVNAHMWQITLHEDAGFHDGTLLWADHVVDTLAHHEVGTCRFEMV